MWSFSSMASSSVYVPHVSQMVMLLPHLMWCELLISSVSLKSHVSSISSMWSILCVIISSRLFKFIHMIISNHVIHFESCIPMHNIWFIIFICMFIFHLWWMSTFLISISFMWVYFHPCDEFHFIWSKLLKFAVLWIIICVINFHPRCKVSSLSAKWTKSILQMP